MPRPIQPSAFSYLLPSLVQSGDNSQSSGASGWTPGGALSLQIPDNTVIGGNPRGLGAVDLQTQRTAATQVASGAGSFVAGVNNTASGAQAVAFGTNSTASGPQAFATGSSSASGLGTFATGASSANGSRSISSGTSNSSGTCSVALGFNNNSTTTTSMTIGESCTASGPYGSVALGYTSVSSSYISTALTGSTANGDSSFAAGFSTSSGFVSVAMGQSSASANYSVSLGRSAAAQIGKFSHSGTRYAATGDAQTGILVVRASTTDATPTVATSDGAGAGTGNQLILSNSSAFTFSILVVARQQAAGGTASAAWEIKGLIRREANAASTTLVNSTTTVIDNTPGWAVAVSASTTNGGLTITVTGAAATNIRWVATAYTSEVIYA